MRGEFMEEVWKDIEGYEGLYQVSNFGRVKSLIRASKVLSAKTNGCGHMSVRLCNKGEHKDFLVHRLVATAFCHKPNGCNVVHHIDNNPENNLSDNLKWVTPAENVHSSSSVGFRTTRPIVRSDGITEVYYPSVSAAQKEGFLATSICKCCKGKSKTYKGYTWRYAT